MIDPFATLSIHRAATKREILQRVAMVLRDRSRDARTVAEAQRTLFSPLDRAAAEFIHCLDAEPLATEEPACPPANAQPMLDPLEFPHEKKSITS